MTRTRLTNVLLIPAALLCALTLTAHGQSAPQPARSGIDAANMDQSVRPHT